MKGYIVYIHRRKDNGNVFYVGYGSDRGRAYDQKSRNKYWKEVLSETFFDVEILATSLSKKGAESLEKGMIDFYGVDNLVNRTKGGLGTTGYSHTQETKDKIALSHRGRNKSKEVIDKAVETKRNLHSSKYIHRETAEIILGLKWACEKYDVNYKRESQRIRRNSANRVFNKTTN